VGVFILFDLGFVSNRAIGGTGLGTGRVGGYAAGGGLEIAFAFVSADTLTIESNLAQGGFGLSGASGGYGYGGGVADLVNTQFALTNSTVTLNKALGSLGSTPGEGFGGGIDSEGTGAGLDLTGTTYTPNFVNNGVEDDLRIV
jgi:hypothetical protein